MDRQRKIMIAFLIIGVPLFIWIQFFEVPNKVKVSQEKMQQDPKTHVFESVTQYGAEYMGDAANISHLVSELPLNEYKEAIELDPDDLTIKIEYGVHMDEIEKKAQQGVIYNSTAVFALIENAEQMDIQFDNKIYSISRDRVEKWFGTTLVDLKDPEVFQEKVQSQLTEEDVLPWFLAYTESE